MATVDAVTAHGAIDTLNRLRVYEMSRRWAVRCCVIARGLPSADRFVVGQQLTRAALSVKSNIAEGHGRRSSNADFRNFLRIARGSLTEAYCQLELLADLGLISNVEMASATYEARQIDRLIGGLLRHLMK